MHCSETTAQKHTHTHTHALLRKTTAQTDHSSDRPQHRHTQTHTHIHTHTTHTHTAVLRSVCVQTVCQLQRQQLKSRQQQCGEGQHVCNALVLADLGHKLNVF